MNAVAWMPRRAAARYDPMRITFKGIVQGVGFRPAVYRTAKMLGLKGRVWNSGPDVIVDIDDGYTFFCAFMLNLPPLAIIESVDRCESHVDYIDFQISPSTDGDHGVSIPTDVAVCDECISDMSSGRRKWYPFTSCTSCGPRFTLLEGMPYDRRSTSMDTFGICENCSKEYSDPDDRRFHHQTICCPICGPSYKAMDCRGNIIPGDPLECFSDILAQGGIGIVKGWGGMHICCTVENLPKMRKWYVREQKPFAIMVKDLNTAYKFGDPTDVESEHLTSPHRPIVLIKKKDNDINEWASPGLDNIGIFLPYTGMHHMIFDRMGSDALVMTSANLPGEPMMIDDISITELGADVYLIHDQPISNRADDSVIRINDGRTSFIRRSRGHVPFFISTDMKGPVIAVGAQENLTGSIAKDGRIHMTQHIGDGLGFGVVDYLEDSIRTHMSLLGCRPQVVAVDLHPRYSNRQLAKDLAEEYGAELREVQHHWAHSASLMAEQRMDRLVTLTLDGTGHGDDGNAWGGEVLMSDLSRYDRVAHLEYIPLLGSEKALYDLRRLKFAIDTMNGVENFLFDDNGSTILKKMMNKSVMTSSMGRLMDALSFTLGVCTKRTYDGEPAMKLEPLLARGKLIEGFDTKTKNGTVMTVDLFSRIDKGMERADVAYSIVYNVMDELIQNASERASSEGINAIGITGGVSYNSTVCRIFSDIVSRSGNELIFHNDVPSGDGGISVGQAAIALKMIQ